MLTHESRRLRSWLIFNVGQNMTSAKSLSAFLVAVTLTAASEPVDRNPVRMPAVHVEASAGRRIIFLGWSPGIDVNGKSGEITKFYFSKIEAGSSAKKAGLKVGDQITSVDGQPVAGMDWNELFDVFWAKVKSRERATFSLSTQTGSPRREIVVDVLVANAKTPEPNQALEPTPMSVTSPATQEPRRP